MSSLSVLGSLRRRECQTRQQQFKHGTPRQIGYQHPTQEQFPLNVQTTSSQSQDIGSLGNSNSNGNDASSYNPSGGIARTTTTQSRELESRTLPTSSSYPAVHPLSTSFTPSTLRSGGTGTGGAAMEWSPSSPSHLPTSGASSKGLAGQGFGSSAPLGGAHSVGLNTLRNSHLSVAQMGGAGRRMSTPSIPTTLRPSSHGSSTPSSSTTISPLSTSHLATSAPRPGFTFSNSRPWTGSPAAEVAPSLTPTATQYGPVSSQPHSYHNTNQVQRSSTSLSLVPPKDKESHGPQRKPNPTLDLISSRMPSIISEREYIFEDHDKIFATTWVTYDDVLVGTKCNKIILLNTHTGKRTSISRMEECLLESSESVLSKLGMLAAEEGNTTRTTPTQTTNLNARAYGTSYTGHGSPSDNNPNLAIVNGLQGLRLHNHSGGRRSSTPSYPFAPNASRAIPSSIANGSSTTGRSTSSTAQSSTGTGDTTAGSNGSQDAPIASGIRSMSINPSRTLLAIGSGDHLQVSIYSLPEFEPMGIMYGHTDIVFSVKWISDTVLVTGCKDGSMRVWTMGSPLLTTLPTISQLPIEVRQSVLTRTEENTGVRGLTLNNATGQVMTLGSNGFVKLWDRESFNQISKMKLIHTSETVCITSNAETNLFAVGSQSHISLIDPRSSNIVHVIDSCDEGWGVRSLDFKSHILTTGGGFGRIGFYDVRAQRYLDEFDNGKKYLEVGHGWLNYESIIAMSVPDIQIRSAVYAMEYDCSGTRLFAAGGPLQLRLNGAYAGLWA
ncbi:WD40-repeat-containing domain protein [Mortierella sp. GBAus27b]|nr:WD40-repeat-containing domain protein [Mortierella sp. GBAus27b]